MQAGLRILETAGAQLDIETIEIGESVYRQGHTAGIVPAAWDSLRRTKVFYKSPITTPQGGGFKSLNVTVRKTLGLYANVRPCVSYHPFVKTKHPKMDVVIIRENEEDLYAGIEHRQTDQVYQCLKLITRPGCEKIVRYTFEYARRNGRRKVTCFTKDNIMKLTDGLFHKVFDEIAVDYPDIANEHWIVDIGAAKLADTPEVFDVIVMPNLYGDILSDVAAQITGSVGLAGSANIGGQIAMFEAIHGSAPDIAGKNQANPSGLLLAGVMMLVHLRRTEVAARVHNAWLRTLEDGLHTADIFKLGTSQVTLTTTEFADAVIERLGLTPRTMPVVRYENFPTIPAVVTPTNRRAKKEVVGVDIFVEHEVPNPEELGKLMSRVKVLGLKLSMITNSGVKDWPNGLPETFCTDHWRCRFLQENGGVITHNQIIAVLLQLDAIGVDVIKSENLCTFDGEPGYSLGQGQ